MHRPALKAFALPAILAALLVAAQPEELARRAQEAMAAARYTEAAGLYRELMRELPNTPGIRFNYALALHSAGRYEEAVAQLDQVVREAPGMTNAWLILGLAYQKLGEPEKAIHALDRVVKAEPRNTIALLELGDACLSAGRLPEAVKYFLTLSALDPSASKPWQGLGVAYVSLARQMFEQLELTAPDSPFVYALMAQARLDQAQYRTAYVLYRKALASNSGIPGLHEGVASIYRATGHDDWAITEAAKENKQACAPGSLACAFMEGRFEEIVAAPNSPEALYWKSRAYSSLGEQALRRLAALPESAELHEVLGEVYRIQGRKEDSVREWREALRLAPTDAYAGNGLAKALWLHRDYTEAQPLLERLLKNAPGSPELNYELGDILLEEQKVEEALPLLRKAVLLSPGKIAARGSLGRALLKVGQPREAIPHLEAALPQDEDGSLHYQLGRAWQQVGNPGKARQCFEEQQKLVAARQEPAAEEAGITPP